MTAGIKANSDGSAAIQVGGTDVITLTSGGAATFVTSPTTVQAGTAAAPSITTSGDTNTGIFFPAADTIAFATAGTEDFRIASAGQIGIGGANYGTSGQVLTSQGASSAPVWADPVPAGSVIWFAANTAPTGYLKANGASLSTTTYATLFAAIGYTFGGSGGSFNVPDLRGEFIRGWDDGRGVDTGRVFGSAQSDAIRNITGTAGGTAWGRRSGTTIETGALRLSNGPNQLFAGTGSSATFAVLTLDASLSVPTAAENRPRNIALLACIKF
jgi:microcystin-dependent protein